MDVKCPNCGTDNTKDSEFCKKCGTQITKAEEQPIPTKTLEAPKEELTTGSTFAGRYQIIEELGRGGMGRVYKATDTKINEKVALKLIKPEIASDKKTLERFANELKIARKIAHKNVGRMYDINEEKGTHYITMEYVSGQDLKGLIRQTGQLAIGTSISIIKQVCDGLSEAHRTGVTHRDLKPSNIMIDKEGNVRIMDFGIARSLKEKGITGAGVMIGTPEYMSPEQAEAKEVDQRSDIYSLGVIFYEMVTGRLPFEGDTALSIAMKHKMEIPKDPRELIPQVPEDLSQLILNCLEKDKDSRFQSAGEIQSELENIEKGIPTTDRAIPKRKPITSKEITVTFGLKKLFIPVLAIVAVVIIALILWKVLLQKETAPPLVEKPSIAVLPFVDLSPQKDQEHFCDGMTDEIISKLSGISGWKVMNRTSMMRYKNSEKDPKEIGRELGVATILEGSIRKEKDDIRLSTRLINVEDGFQLWSDIYSRKLESIFIIQNDIAENITQALKMKLSPEEIKQIQKKPTTNLKAYNLYLQGRYFTEKRTEEDLKKAIEYFDQAINEDPNYAHSHLGLATAYILLPEYSAYHPIEANLRATESVKEALEIDETLAEAHALLGSLKYRNEFDWSAAEKEFKKDINLNPNSAVVHHWYAIYLGRASRLEEAIEEIKLARELDPFSLVINRNVGMIFYWARKYDRAIESLSKTIEMDQNFSQAHFYLGSSYLQMSMFEDALSEFQREREITKGINTYLEASIGVVYLRMGKREKAEQIFNELVAQSNDMYISPYGLAWLYFALGKEDQGFESLEMAYKERDTWLIEIKVEPLLDSVRSDPRFKELLKKMNLE